MNMKNKISAITIIASSMVPMYAYATTLEDVGNDVANAAADVGNAASDAAITTKVKALLAMESDIPLDISVTTENHVVYVAGTVATRLQADRIIEIAQSVKSVYDVNDSKLKVQDSNSYFGDATITAKAKGKLIQLSEDGKIAKNYDLSVETTNGEVHIFGVVGNKADVDTIKKAVDGITGVKNVKTNIQAKKR